MAWTRYLMPAVAGLAAAALAAAILLRPAGPAAAELPVGCILNPPSTIGGPISLVDQTGAPVTEATFAGAPALLYFGFAYCPDICPLALQTAKAALADLGPEGEAVQPALISLDPERDTPEQLARYVASPAFPAGLRGLTGTPEQTAAAAKTFRVAWGKAETPGSAADYLIDHSSFFYLMRADWTTAAVFPSQMAPPEAAACMRAGLAPP